MIEEQEYKEIPLKIIGKYIGWILLVTICFLFYEAMAREFSFFDEFSIFIVLVWIGIKLNSIVTVLKREKQIQEKE